MKNNNTKKRRNIMRKFIDTAYQLMQEENYENISVRQLAKNTHYNISTLYYYFDNIEHLMTYVSIKYLNRFINEQINVNQNYMNSIDKFLKIWKLLTKYAFKYPDQYYMIFFGDYSNKMYNILETYEKLYPVEYTFEIKNMPLIKTNEGQTIMPLLDLCIAHGHIKAQDKSKLIEIIEIIFKGMLEKAKNESDKNEIEDMENNMIEYLKLFLKSYQTPIGMSLML